LNFSVPIFWKVVRTPKSQQDPAAIAAAVARLNQILQIAENKLAAQSFLTGDDFTLADVMFGHLLYRFYTIDIERAALPNIDRYYQDLQARPAYREHVMVNYDELRAKD
jgi:glutathione S-transferase